MLSALRVHVAPAYPCAAISSTAALDTNNSGVFQRATAAATRRPTIPRQCYDQSTDWLRIHDTIYLRAIPYHKIKSVY